MRFVLGCLAGLVLAASAQADTAELAAPERRAVLVETARLLEGRYVDPAKGRQLARHLREDAQRDRFAMAVTSAAFSASVTERLRTLSGDGHLGLETSAVAEESEGSEAHSQAEAERWYGRAVNHGFEAVTRLDGNIGYLDLRVFAPPAMGGDVAAAAMTLLAQSDAVIIDLRRNGGGDGGMTQLLAAYLFDGEPQPMSGTFDRPSGQTSAATTPSWVPGRRLGRSKPVYLLTSRRTFSAAEAFAYDLKALGRVTIVGERTGGGGHPFIYRRVNERFVLTLPEARSINPLTGGNWQGIGVKPDVEVAASEALETALTLARKKVSDPLEARGR